MTYEWGVWAGRCLSWLPCFVAVIDVLRPAWDRLYRSILAVVERGPCIMLKLAASFGLCLRTSNAIEHSSHHEHVSLVHAAYLHQASNREPKQTQGSALQGPSKLLFPRRLRVPVNQMPLTISERRIRCLQRALHGGVGDDSVLRRLTAAQ